MDSISEKIKRLNEIQTKLQELDQEYAKRKQEIQKDHETQVNRMIEEFNREIDAKRDEIREKITVQYNSKAQNLKMYYESINFKPLNKEQLAEIFISIMKRELDEVRKNI
ncbi:MAG: hypothetical protein N3C61_00970 [Candidatus Micrarchaeota archaeon]|nr:hypothetical protein [Candidatus Micrarchaeota archaeon]